MQDRLLNEVCRRAHPGWVNASGVASPHSFEISAALVSCTRYESSKMRVVKKNPTKDQREALMTIASFSHWQPTYHCKNSYQKEPSGKEEEGGLDKAQLLI